MKAFQLVAHGKPGRFDLRHVLEPVPAADEVVVKVHACGLNHLDLWLEEGALPITVDLPRTPGCEIAGTVDGLGADVEHWRIGDRVAVQSNLFCGTCEFCRRGEESICLNSQLLGVERDGGFADKVVVPARALVRLPDSISFETSAALTLAASTAMHMLADRAEVRSGDWVLVVGASSGVGSAAIQIAKQLGAKVITTASSDAKRDFGASLGADHVVDSTKADWAAQVRKLTGKHGVDVVIEHVGGAMLQQVFQCLARNGTIVTCGATGGREVSVNLWPFFVKQHRLIGSYGRNLADMRATLEWAADGRLRPVIDQVFSLADAGKAFARLRERNVLGKLIVKP
ncbi:MAG: zinc-binding dehydrogenase [Verrucomicrobiota bacterium]